MDEYLGSVVDDCLHKVYTHPARTYKHDSRLPLFLVAYGVTGTSTTSITGYLIAAYKIFPVYPDGLRVISPLWVAF